MNKLCRVGRRGLWPTLLLGLIALMCAVLARPQAALAHPLDAYLQATYITVAPEQIVVELDLTPGVLLAPQVLPQLDPDGDQKISDAEGRAYVDALLQDVALKVDGQALALTATKIDMPPYLNVQAGYGTIRIFTTVALAEGMTGSHQIDYKNNFAPAGSVYQVNAFVDKDVPITLGKQNRDDIQQSMTMDYVIGGAASSATATTSTELTLTPVRVLLALAVAIVPGGLYALTRAITARHRARHRAGALQKAD
jgi:hypothetical protein